MGKNLTLAEPKGLALDCKTDCPKDGILRDVLGRNKRGWFDMNYCRALLGEPLARDAVGLLRPISSFAPGEITEICGVESCGYTGGTADGSTDCSEPQCPDCGAYSTCAVIELTLDTPAGLLEGTGIYAVVDPETGNLSASMGSIAGDVYLGSVEAATAQFALNAEGVPEQTAATCPTVLVRVGVDPKAAKPVG